MVIVLVPTGTPFSADRRLEAERHHFGQRTTAAPHNITAAKLHRAYSATDGAAPMWPPLLQAPQAALLHLL
jgi:hypothetical protein